MEQFLHGREQILNRGSKMLDKIKDFQKIAKKAGRDENSLEEFTLYLEALEQKTSAKDFTVNNIDQATLYDIREILFEMIHGVSAVYKKDIKELENAVGIDKVESMIKETRSHLQETLTIIDEALDAIL